MIDGGIASNAVTLQFSGESRVPELLTLKPTIGNSAGKLRPLPEERGTNLAGNRQKCRQPAPKVLMNETMWILSM